MRRIHAVAVLALVGVLTACAAGTIPFLTGAPRPDAVPVDAVVCADEFGPAEGVVAGNVPEGFTPVAVQRCTLSASQRDEIGTWAGPLNERLEGDLTDLLAALTEPDEAPTMGACSAVMWMGPELWLADAEGRYIRVPYPMGACPEPRPDVLERIEAALAALTVTEATFVQRALVESDAATAAGCATTAGMLVALAGVAPGAGVVAEASELGGDPVEVIPWEPPALPDAAEVQGMQLCRYAVGVPSTDGGSLTSNDLGTFTYAEELDAVAAGEAFASFAGAPSAGHCVATASVLVVAHPTGHAAAGFTVELDGCQRVVGPDLAARAAPPEMLALLQP
ncbi:hypothetical protein LQ938_12500 [Microbacterium sp. cx-55]|uniref:hypothetical protein n=1 Tax=Microbacterium sp. cx-55 TaxID=2875948 RepID=UPI001CBCBB85|nr:hypothetical protein [Microbacterium sp. cx-55]MBZ4487912.1 hypothetical protein [Microbacterium sp. cx-55]UGB34677.1 hypothetical protein LQ938_12500 [Microbacterium sp. cx-55]